MGAGIKRVTLRRKGRIGSTKQRVEQLHERLAVESDPQRRKMIEAQLVAFDRRWRKRAASG